MTKTKQTVKSTSKTSTKRKVNAKKQIIGKPAMIIMGVAAVIAITVSAFALIGTTYATGAPKNNDVPITSTAQASVSNVSIDVSDNNTIRAQFDYALANNATQATVDMALGDNFSLGQVTVTGSGHYDQTTNALPDGTYFVAIIISGNPDYVLGDPGPSNQPLTITLPDTAAKSHGGHNVFNIEKFFHKQKQYFK